MGLGDKIKETTNFPKVFFGMTENLEYLLSFLRRFNGQKVLTVAGSGDSVISFLLQGAEVTGVDISASAIDWTEMKIACANCLSADEYVNLMNALNPNQLRSYDFALARKSIDSLDLAPGNFNLKYFFCSEE